MSGRHWLVAVVTAFIVAGPGVAAQAASQGAAAPHADSGADQHAPIRAGHVLTRILVRITYVGGTLPTFRFSGITTVQVRGEAAAWTTAAERRWLAPVAVVAVNVAVSSAWTIRCSKLTESRAIRGLAQL